MRAERGERTHDESKGESIEGEREGRNVGVKRKRCRRLKGYRDQV